VQLKLAFFWHGILRREINVYFQQQLLIIRTNAQQI
jgi:hypothetical protein